MNVLLTGATGTFGNMFLHEALTQEWGVDRVCALARSESRLAEQTAKWSHTPQYRPFLGDVRDPMRMRDACRGIHVVVHAAALKRVETGAYNSTEMWRTNVFGTETVCRAAMDQGVRKVLIVSSDKAVEPTTFYGATKYLAEQVAIQFNTTSLPRGTAIAAVRYGNVLGSTGSVLHVWQAAQDAGRPLPLTDPAMTRFVLTIREAVQFAWHATQEMRAGEIMVPILESCTMATLAEAFAPNYPTKIVGLRAGGEKRHEVLLFEHEHPRCRRDAYGYVVTPDNASWKHVARGEPSVWEPGERYSSGNPRCLVSSAATIHDKIARAFAEGV